MIHNQASVTLNITKCTTIGPPRIGKTCFKYLLTGQQWDLEAGTASTDVMETPEWVECYSVGEGGAEELWKLVSKEQQQGELLRAINRPELIVDRGAMELSPLPEEQQQEELLISDHARSTTLSDTTSTTEASDTPPPTETSDTLPPTEASDTLPPTEASDTLPPTEASDTSPPTETNGSSLPTEPRSTLPLTQLHDIFPPTKQGDTQPKTVLSDTLPPTELSVIPIPSESSNVQPPISPSTLMQGVEALANVFSSEHVQSSLKDKEGKVLGQTRLVHFIDTGGQAIYHDVHPVLITSPSVYLVVFSLKELYLKKSHEDQLNYFRSDLIQRPLRSIYTFGTKTLRNKDYVTLHSEAPKIFIVGTHLDQIPVKELDRQTFLDDVSKRIEREISNKPYRQFVQFDTKYRSFWAVDNTLAGREQDEEFRMYSSNLRMMMQEGSMEMSVKVPLPWMLLKVVMDSKGERYCKYSELLQEACNRGYVSKHLPDADLDTMLWLFHILGLFYHKVPRGYKKEDSLVFIDPDCLYSATSDFLMATKEEIRDSSEDQCQTLAATKEDIEDSQGDSEEDQHQLQAATMEETEDYQGNSEEDHHQTQAATKKDIDGSQVSGEEDQHQTQTATEHNQGGSEEDQHQTQATTKEDIEDSQGGNEEEQHQSWTATIEDSEDSKAGNEEDQTQAATTDETEDSHGCSEEGQHWTQATTMKKIKGSQGQSEDVQQQTQAANTEETGDSQGGSEEDQTQAASTDETEDGQGGNEEGQCQLQAVPMEKIEESQGGSEEDQQQTHAATTDETGDSHGGSAEGQHHTQAANTEKTGDSHGGSEEDQTQAATTDETEDGQGSNEEGQCQLQAVPMEETENSQGSSENQYPTLASNTDETEDSQGGSEDGQHQTQAANTEKTGDSQGGSEVDQTQAATTNETEDGQGGNEEGQCQLQAVPMEKIEESQGGSEEDQQQTHAATTDETEDSQGGSAEGQHHTQAANTKKTGNYQGGSEEDQTQAATTDETEDSQGGNEEGQHQTQASTMEEMCHDEEMAGIRSRQQKQELKGIVQKRRVIERIQSNYESIQHEMEAVLQVVECAMTQKVTEALLESLHAQLRDSEQQYKLPSTQEGQDASSVKAKRQLFIGRLVNSLASSVKAVLNDVGMKPEAHVKKEVKKAVENLRVRYQSRFINSHDMDQFLCILKDLRIVAELSDSNSFVIPAALPEVHHSVQIAGKADPILFTVMSQTIMQVCFLPSGLFCCLISELVTELGWTVMPLGRTHVAFTHIELSGKVHIIEHESYIEIKLESDKSLLELSKTCQSVREKIHKHVVDVYKTLYSGPTAGSTFEESLVWGFQCKAHPDDDTHIAAFEEDDYECCAECLLPDSSALQPITAAQRVWGLMTA